MWNNESDDDSGPSLGFERYKDFDDLLKNVDASQANDDEMDSLDSDYDDMNLRMNDWMFSLLFIYYWYLM